MDLEEAARLHRDAHAKLREKRKAERMTPLDGLDDDPGAAPAANATPGPVPEDAPADANQQGSE